MPADSSDSDALYQGTTLELAENSLYEGHGFSRAASSYSDEGFTGCGKNSISDRYGLPIVPAPDFSPGERAFKPAETLVYKFRALALVAASLAAPTFSASCFSPWGTSFSTLHVPECVPHRLKPRREHGFCGTAEAVPFVQRVFPQPVQSGRKGSKESWASAPAERTGHRKAQGLKPVPFKIL